MRAFPLLGCVAISLGMLGAAFGHEDRQDRRSHRPARVTFYEHSDFRGASFTVDAGQRLPNLTRVAFSNGAGVNDRISSVKIDGDIDVLVFRDIRFGGGAIRLTHDVRDLRELGPGWNDVISSLRVEPSDGPRRHSRD